MPSRPENLAEFRFQISTLLQERDWEWQASRRLIEAGRLMPTLKRLVEQAHRTELSPVLREAIVVALNNGDAVRIQDLAGSRLKALTGLPPSKAVRALCLWFGLVEPPASRWPVPRLDSQAVAAYARDHTNPFDLLLASDVASVLDLGAGDLSFATELADHYVDQLGPQGATLTLHCIDRLHPQSKLGGPLHADEERLQALRSRPGLSFEFFGNQDLCGLDVLDRTARLASRYAIVTCWAPATPTFAYEPTRLSGEVIREELERTKGAFRRVQYAGEPALEVRHRDRALLFPPWKFDIRGPLALLEVVSRRGHLCVLGAVDSQVFWELLAQLLEEERYRPKDQPFTAANVAGIFGDLHERLSALALGETLDLSACASLRRTLPAVLPGAQMHQGYNFRAVLIRRGAVFPNMPASSTARKFGEMVEETPPWMIILVPDH